MNAVARAADNLAKAYITESIPRSLEAEVIAQKARDSRPTGRDLRMYEAFKPVPDPASLLGRVLSKRLNFDNTSLPDVRTGFTLTANKLDDQQSDPSLRLFDNKVGQTIGEIFGKEQARTRQINGVTRPGAFVTAQRPQDFFATVPDFNVGNIGNGAHFDGANYKGIEGDIYCLSDNCQVTLNLFYPGDWFFFPDKDNRRSVDRYQPVSDNTYLLNDEGTYKIERTYVHYGHWLEDDGANIMLRNYANMGETYGQRTNKYGVWTAPAVTGPLSEVSATYQGHAAGNSIREELDAEGYITAVHYGTFEADVTLEATFAGPDSRLGGIIDNFRSTDTPRAVDPNWQVELVEQAIAYDDLVNNNFNSELLITSYAGNAAVGKVGGTVSGDIVGAWESFQYAGEANIRPKLIYGGFQAFFKNGTVAGSYATRKVEE